MTDTLHQPHRSTSPEEDTAPAVTSAAPFPEAEPPSPPESVSGRSRRKTARLTTSHLVAIVASSLLVLAVVAAVAFSQITSWLHDAASDTAEWAEAETQLAHVHELATQQFLQTIQALRSSEGLSFVIEAQGEEIAGDIDHLVTLATTISGDTRFAELAEQLHEANAALTAAGVTGIENIEAGKIAADTIAIFELELAFANWRGAHAEFSGAMRAAQSAAVNEQSSRADTASKTLAAISALAVVVLSGAWYLGSRSRKRAAILQEKVNKEKELLTTIINQIPDLIIWKDSSLRVRGCNSAMADFLDAAGAHPSPGGRIPDQAPNDRIAETISRVEGMEREVLETGEAIHGHQVMAQGPSGEEITMLHTIVPLKHGNKTVGVVSTGHDVSEVLDLERSLASAGRLESIGQLAAGVAHEINTPVQFVSDNASFLGDSFGEVISALNSISELMCECNAEALAEIQKSADLEFLVEEIPDAITQSQEGLQQIARIVRAMKDFAHPGGESGPADVNRLIKSTVDVSRNEWKYDAEMQLDLAEDLAQPHCDAGQIKQVLLNMIVNAAHAIADTGRGPGTIAVATTSDEEAVTIRISDNGAGMTDEVKKRIFERFFTTKEVGRGSGQGLAIAYDAINAHGGTISVDSTVGIGTTFTIQLPIQPNESTS